MGKSLGNNKNLFTYLKEREELRKSPKRVMRENRDLSKYAGCITEEQAERLLKAVRDSRDSWDN